MKKNLLLVACCSTFLMPTVWAANSSIQSTGAILTVQGQAETLVQNDQAQIQFTATEEAPNAQRAQNRATQRINQALESLAPWKDRIVIKTEQFSTWPIYNQPKDGQTRKITAWNATQSIRVVVKDLSILSRLTKAASQHMTYSGVTFQVSPEKQKKVNEQLTQNAIRDAQKKALLAARTLGQKNPTIAVQRLNLGTYANSQPRYYALAASDSARSNAVAVAPQFEAGETKLHYQVTLEAKIQ